MALDTVTAIPDASRALAPTAAETAPRNSARRVRRRIVSPLTLRILAINVVALATLGGGLFFLGEYQQNLVNSQIESLRTQAQIFGAALGEGAVTDALDNGEALIPERSRDMMRRLVEPTHIRARLFDAKGQLLGDTHVFGTAMQAVQIDELPPPDQSNFAVRFAHHLYDLVIAWLPVNGSYSSYVESGKLSDYPEVQRAYQGDVATAVHRNSDNAGLVTTAAVPVQHYKQVLGVVLLSASGADIEQAVRAVRFTIIELFVLAFGITVFLSLYLAGTIARPVRLLAQAAERVRHGQGRQPAIPDFTNRGDEIGDLSGALREMTDTLWRRMAAIEHFAADVAHELKNPLTSLRSAVETVLRVSDPEKQQRLFDLILHDVNRLTRLITDISEASRLDAEMSRDESSVVAIGPMLATLQRFYADAAGPDAPTMTLDLPGLTTGPDADLPVRGSEERLVRVFRNLLDNAISFSPPGGAIAVRARRTGDMIRVAVEDEGPGLPEGKFEAIFNRFYSERPASEDYGNHSGLGLAISKQIIEAHHGVIRAENRRDRDGRLVGARFIVDLPQDDGKPARS